MEVAMFENQISTLQVHDGHLHWQLELTTTTNADLVRFHCKGHQEHLYNHKNYIKINLNIRNSFIYVPQGSGTQRDAVVARGRETTETTKITTTKIKYKKN